MRMFHIGTLVTNPDQYRDMKASFLEAGFDERRCRYTVLDNTSTNRYDAFRAYNYLREITTEPYIIFCHQDVLLNQGDDYDALLKRIEELEATDPDWAIAGNAGGTDTLRLSQHLSSPSRDGLSVGRFPHRVHSLDENFLLVKSSVGIECTPELTGFHFYGADLCLQAARKRKTCYVIDFHLTHLSDGTIDHVFEAARAEFQRRWNRSFRFCYVRTTCTLLFLSRYRLLFRVFDSPRALAFMEAHTRLYAMLAFARHKLQGKKW